MKCDWNLLKTKVFCKDVRVHPRWILFLCKQTMQWTDSPLQVKWFTMIDATIFVSIFQPTCMVNSWVGSISPLLAFRSASSRFFWSSSSRVVILDFSVFLCPLRSIYYTVGIRFHFIHHYFLTCRNCVVAATGLRETCPGLDDTVKKGLFVPLWFYILPCLSFCSLHSTKQSGFSNLLPYVSFCISRPLIHFPQRAVRPSLPFTFSEFDQ